MYRWICLMTVKSPKQREPEPFRSRSHFSSRSFCVKPKVRRGLGSSPLSDYLYSPTPPSPHTSSPYTDFFSPPAPSLTSTNTSSVSEDSSVLTSPGRISPVRRSVSSSSSSVYSQLFRPDLIKLSSPLHAKHQSEQRRLTRSSSSNQTVRTRDEFTNNWLEDNRHIH